MIRRQRQVNKVYDLVKLNRLFIFKYPLIPSDSKFFDPLPFQKMQDITKILDTILDIY